MKGKIYGFIGVIGSGKSYRAERLVSECRENKRPVIMGDFSEGIRRISMNMLLGEPRIIDVLSKEYSNWKNSKFEVPLPFNNPSKIVLSGRQILKNVGEGLKEAVDPAIWANWTENYVLDTLDKYSADATQEQMDDTTIVFGSVRFPVEARVLFRLSERLGREVEIVFCNYKSSVYELSPHVSERFAQYFIDEGYNDGDDITKVVREIVEKEISCKSF